MILMGVEIRQLTIKSILSSREERDAASPGARISDLDVESLKEQIMDACREQIARTLSDSRDR